VAARAACDEPASVVVGLELAGEVVVGDGAEVGVVD